jgi:hypothetical protein
MKAEPILQELETVKERFTAEANYDTRRFLDQMEAWMEAHPHAGPVVNSPEELQSRLRAREAAEPKPPKTKPYKVHNPIIAEIHRYREGHALEVLDESMILKDEPPRKNS